MSNHMTAIGFNVQSAEDFEQVAEYAYETGESIETARGIYLLAQAGSGIEIWLQMNTENQVIGLNPHYFGSSRFKVKLTDEIIRSEGSELDGTFHVWAEFDGETEESDSYPFVFEMPNRAVYRDVQLPRSVTIQLTAFAHELSVFDSEEQFHESQQHEEVKFAAEAFIPTGLFVEEGEPGSMAMFTGQVQQSAWITNEYTGKSFHWALVRTLGGEIDVVADRETLDEEIPVGGIVSGTFWLSAKIIEE
ncbi:hypothetical protein [Saccharibacillus deserti]|uniref:hypothetical protein n=1 Tax=Saccharibacillus deserti TaxID=1634444 RepID=UPI0015573359|nr:hypothetical protein [Saccharibacillus deserti]